MMPGPTLHAAWEGLLLVLSWPNILYPIAGTLLAMAVAFLPGHQRRDADGARRAFHADVGAAAGDADLRRDGRRRHVHGVDHRHPVQRSRHGPERGHADRRTSDGRTGPGAYRHRLRGDGVGDGIERRDLRADRAGAADDLCDPRVRPARAAAAPALGPDDDRGHHAWRRHAERPSPPASGLLLALVGHDARTAEERFTFGALYLGTASASCRPCSGCFRSPRRCRSASPAARHLRPPPCRAARGQRVGRVRAVFTHFGLFLRSALVGTLVGIIPGVGGTVASFLAYGQAVQNLAGS